MHKCQKIQKINLLSFTVFSMIGVVTRAAIAQNGYKLVAEPLNNNNSDLRPC